MSGDPFRHHLPAEDHHRHAGARCSAGTDEVEARMSARPVRGTKRAELTEAVRGAECRTVEEPEAAPPLHGSQAMFLHDRILQPDAVVAEASEHLAADARYGFGPIDAAQPAQNGNGDENEYAGVAGRGKGRVRRRGYRDIKWQISGDTALFQELVEGQPVIVREKNRVM